MSKSRLFLVFRVKVVFMSDKIVLFKSMLAEYMLRKSDQLEADRVYVINRISLSCLDSDHFYALLVQDIRADTMRTIFRDLSALVDVYLS